MSLAIVGRNIVYVTNRITGQLYRTTVQRMFPLNVNRNRFRFYSTSNTLAEQEKSEPKYEVTFIKKNGERITAKGKEGDSLLDVVVNNSLDFDGYGACEGTLTCSTCHVILKKEDYDRLPSKPSEEELDMLDLAYELSDTSRLGCQIILNKDLDGLEIYLPSSINDARQ